MSHRGPDLINAEGWQRRKMWSSAKKAQIGEEDDHIGSDRKVQTIWDENNIPCWLRYIQQENVPC